MNFLAIDVHSKSYYLLTNNEVEKCKQFKETLICIERHPIYHINNDNHCEIDLFLHEHILTNLCDIRVSFSPQFWVQLEQTNLWIYSIKGQIPIKLICGNNISIYTLKNEGTVEIPSSIYQY